MMEVATSFADLALDRPALLTIGTFDGVHRGHRFLLEQAQQRAIEHGYGLVIVTFDPCPALVLRPDLRRYQLTTVAQKLRLLRSVDPAVVLVLTFDTALSHLTAGEFMDELEARLQVREMWLGEDFHFGRGRSGNLAMLVERGRESGFSLHVVSRRMEDSASISSTRVRQSLASGDVEGVLPLLGHPFAVDIAACNVSALPDRPNAPARLAVPSILAMPAEGAYAVLIGDGEDAPVESRAAVATVTDWQNGEIQIYPNAPGIEVEFIARLAADPLPPDALETGLSAARGTLGAWKRPVYPASGKY